MEEQSGNDESMTAEQAAVLLRSGVALNDDVSEAARRLDTETKAQARSLVAATWAHFKAELEQGRYRDLREMHRALKERLEAQRLQRARMHAAALFYGLAAHSLERGIRERGADTPGALIPLTEGMENAGWEIYAGDTLRFAAPPPEPSPSLFEVAYPPQTTAAYRENWLHGWETQIEGLAMIPPHRDLTDALRLIRETRDVLGTPPQDTPEGALHLRATVLDAVLLHHEAFGDVPEWGGLSGTERETIEADVAADPLTKVIPSAGRVLDVMADLLIDKGNRYEEPDRYGYDGLWDDVSKHVGIAPNSCRTYAHRALQAAGIDRVTAGERWGDLARREWVEILTRWRGFKASPNNPNTRANGPSC